MATERPPSICGSGCPIINCCPTLADSYSATVEFVYAGAPPNPPNAPGAVTINKFGCGYQGFVEDYETPSLLSVTLVWSPDDPLDPSVGHWQATWDDLGYYDQYYTASGSTNWCNPAGSYGPATCDDGFCLNPADTSTLTIS